MIRFKKILACLVILLVFAGSQEADSQGFLKKAVKKLGQEAGKAITGGEEDSATPDTSEPDANDSPSSSGNSSGSSAKKKMTPPDVNKNIASAEMAYSQQNYDNTRFAVQQALIGVELEIGYEILNSLPGNLDGQGYSEEDDHVTSTGVGFVGMHIGRKYTDNNKAVDVKILNNAGMIGAMSAVLTNPMYANENQKAVMVGGYKGLLELHNDNYYSLGVPIGQSSVIAMDFNEYADEDKVIAVAEEIDIARIKELLGEQ